MKLPVFRYLFCAAALLLFLSNVKKIASTGAPASSTGAPSEESCAKAGCHTSFSINSGSALLKLDWDAIGGYIPSNTYTLTPSLSDSMALAFGFEIVALDSVTHKNVGEFSITNTNTTQILKATVGSSDRNYITYKVQGTVPVSKGLGQWDLQWTAPNYNCGTVKFYLAATAADGDHTQAGDYVYTSSYSLQPFSGSSKISLAAKQSNEISVYPNPVSNEIRMNTYFSDPGSVKIELLNGNGKVMQTFYNENTKAGNFLNSFSMDKDIPSGFYFVQITSNSEIKIAKILLQHGE